MVIDQLDYESVNKTYALKLKNDIKFNDSRPSEWKF